MISAPVRNDVREGRLTGGPFAFVVACSLATALACGGGSPERPAPQVESTATRPLEMYRRLGLMTGFAEFPAVSALSMVAGPADSTYVLLAMSLPNAALRFQRDAAGFSASYEVTAEFRRNGTVARRFSRTESVFVPNFAEAGRTDESVVFQQAVLLAAGRYEVFLRAGASGTTRTFEATDSLDVAAYDGERGTSMPILIYEGVGRTSREALPELILNPRHTVSYGGKEPRLFIERYGSGVALPITVRVLDEQAELVHVLESELPAGDTEVRTTQLTLPIEALPLGQLWIEVRVSGVAVGRTPLVISISDQWMVANFEEVLQFLRYIATSAELADLGRGTSQQRRDTWDAFWRKRDPMPSTPANEYRDEFFQRMRHASETFTEPGGLPGWRTNRGEVYIVLGPPDFEQERYIGRAGAVQPNGIEWIYESLPGGRVSLLFFDRTGFGRFELTPSSEAAFRSMADRMKPRSD